MGTVTIEEVEGLQYELDCRKQEAENQWREFHKLESRLESLEKRLDALEDNKSLAKKLQFANWAKHIYEEFGCMSPKEREALESAQAPPLSDRDMDFAERLQRLRDFAEVVKTESPPLCCDRNGTPLYEGDEVVTPSANDAHSIVICSSLDCPGSVVLRRTTTASRTVTSTGAIVLWQRKGAA